MRSSTCALASATVLFLGVLQILGAPATQDDPGYQLFEMNIQSQKQQAEYKLISSKEIFVNNTKTYNLIEFDLINSTLINFFESLKKDYPNADSYCLDFIGQDVQQIISDSKHELDACTNLTHSWELIDQLLIDAETVMKKLDDLVNKTLAQGWTCVTKYPFSAQMKQNCFNTANGIFTLQMSGVTALVQSAYYNITGGGLLMGAEVTSCQKAESFSFEEKCDAIRSEVVTNCVPPTSPTTTGIPTTTVVITTTAAPTAQPTTSKPV